MRQLDVIVALSLLLQPFAPLRGREVGTLTPRRTGSAPLSSYQGEPTMNLRPVTTVLAAVTIALLPTTAAFADSPPAVSDNCNAQHGTFGALGGHDDNQGINDPGSNGVPGASNPHAPGAGGETTGESNSSYSAECRASR
jgi:hypothetical protein